MTVFEKKTPQIFNEDGLCNGGYASLHSGGRLSIGQRGNLDRIWVNGGDGTYWTYKALCEAIAELLHVKKEWEEHPLFVARHMEYMGEEERPLHVDEDDIEWEEPDEPEEFPMEEDDDDLDLEENPF